MKLSQFKISVPDNLIATHPAKNREDARLMVLDRKTGKIEHKKFKDILNYFDDGDCMIVNNTRVFPARLYGNKEKTGAKIEVFLRRVVAGQQRDATTFRATLRELRASLGRLRDGLPGFRLDPAHTTRQIRDRERVIAIHDRVAQRNERWGHEWSGESGSVSCDPRS